MDTLDPAGGVDAIDSRAMTAPPAEEVEEDGKLQIRQRVWGIAARVDPTVTFEEFAYWAKIERAEEREANRIYSAERGPLTFAKAIQGRFSKGVHHENAKKADAARVAAQALTDANEKTGGVVTVVDPNPNLTVKEEEWKTAARAMRTAGWGTIFYLVTTDILGWSTTPFVFASVGFGPGVALYVVFGIFAAFSGWILWVVFLGLDSSRFPMVSFGDTYFRVYGSWARHFINVGQALQQFMTVCVLILGSGTIISQLSNEHLCFIVCMLIFTIVGMALGSIRSLQRVGWLANASVWINIVSFIIIMVASAHFTIDYQAVYSSTRIKPLPDGSNAPVITFASTPPDQFQLQAAGFAGEFNGVDSMVYSYGGALLFIAFLAEMRHPWDFWKGMLLAQSFIAFVYILFGAFVYSNYGQYSIGNIVNVIQPVTLQTANNVLSLITGWIACLLYFNIGLKTVYVEVFQDLLHFPDITTRKGRWLWYLLGPIYWSLAFIIAAAIPNFSGVANLVGAFLILNFTYTFPGLLYVGYRTQIDAALPGEGFDPITGITTRHDEGWKRMYRGFMVNWHINSFTTFYFFGGLVCSGMGAWAAIIGLIEIFGPGGTVATSFGCAAPV